MELKELVESLKTETLAPVYLVTGPERFFVDALLARLRALIASGPMADFNFAKVKAGETSGQKVAFMAQEMPMMAQRRLVIADDAEGFKANDWEALDAYFENPSPSTSLVIIAEKLDARRGPVVRASKRGWLHKSEPLKEGQIPSFLKLRAKVRGVTLSAEALQAVSVAIGPDCSALDDAVERLALYVGGKGREVSETDVAEIVTTVRQHSVFELADAIGHRHAHKTVQLLLGLLARREEPIAINAMLARHFRQLLLARIHLHIGTAEHELASVLGTPPFAVKNLLAQARQFRGAVLEAALARLAEVDYELKSSRRSGERVLEEAVLDLCLTAR